MDLSPTPHRRGRCDRAARPPLPAVRPAPLPGSPDRSRPYTGPTMSRSLIERRLVEVNRRLRRAREELSVVDEQLRALVDTAEDARIRALVSETPLADREHHEAQRHADAMARSRNALVASIAELERTQDQLLDRLVLESR